MTRVGDGDAWRGCFFDLFGKVSQCPKDLEDPQMFRKLVDSCKEQRKKLNPAERAALFTEGERAKLKERCFDFAKNKEGFDIEECHSNRIGVFSVHKCFFDVCQQCYSKESDFCKADLYPWQWNGEHSL